MGERKIITISRQYGSGGRKIGQLLARELKIPFYDRELISMAAGESGIAEEFFAGFSLTVFSRHCSGGGMLGKFIGKECFPETCC